MKKIICVTLALLMLLCTACYPTGEEMVNSIEEIDLFEMNKSDNENLPSTKKVIPALQQNLWKRRNFRNKPAKSS